MKRYVFLHVALLLSIVTVTHGYTNRSTTLCTTSYSDIIFGQTAAPDTDGRATSSERIVLKGGNDTPTAAESRITSILNTPPRADDFTVTIDEDAVCVFTRTNFTSEYTNAENNALAYVVISSLPADGLLLLKDDRVFVNDRIRVSDLDDGKLTLVPEPNANGSPYTSFLFRVEDEQGAVSEPFVAIVNVTPVNDPPEVDTVSLNHNEGQTTFFAASHFSSQFSGPENSKLAMVRIESLPDNGLLLVGHSPVAIGDEIPVDRLDKLAFEPKEGFRGTTEFRWNGYDGLAYADFAAPAIIRVGEEERISALNDIIQLIEAAPYKGALQPLVTSSTSTDFVFSNNPVEAPDHGKIILHNDGTYWYEANDGFAGDDVFTFEVCSTDNPSECTQATVTLIVPPALHIYKGFSPDNDGINDVWQISGIENYPNNHVRILDRWGKLVFELEGYNNEDKAWSSYSTTGLVAGQVPNGTYFYLINLGNNQPPRSGYVIVSR